MQIDFIGHGLNTSNKLNVGDQLATSFKSPQFDSFIGFVAFAAISGVSKLLPFIQKAQIKYKKLVFFIGVDNKGTSKQALEILLQNNIETYIYHKEEEHITYHPKLFLFEGEKHSRLIIGSSNLTHSGFLNNIEASIQLDFNTKTDKQGNKLLQEVKRYFNNFIDLSDRNIYKLDKGLIEKYDENGLLYSQFNLGKGKETQTNDGENPVDKSITIPFFENEFGSGKEPFESRSKEKIYSITQNDYEVFPFFLEEYKIYKKEVRSSGVVYKGTDQVELLNWYQRMKELIKHETLPDDLAMQLIEADFPFENGWGANIKMIWDKHFNELVQFKMDNYPDRKFTHVPRSKVKTDPYYSLGTWCASQKMRRKGMRTPAWTDYEETKMNSIQFLWEVPNLGSQMDDEGWYEKLLDLEDYYSNVSNYKTVPSQNTKLGRWLNEQITSKLTGSRKKVKTYLHPLREGFLGEILSKNGVEWEWRKQKDREALEAGIKNWNELIDWEKNLGNRKPTDAEIAKYSETREWISGTRFRSKKWKLKDKWKRDFLLREGFPLPKINDMIDEQGMPAANSKIPASRVSVLR